MTESVIRLSRAAVPVIYDESLLFEIGKGILVRDGGDVTIAATGTVLHQVLHAADILEQEGISVQVVDVDLVQQILRCRQKELWKRGDDYERTDSKIFLGWNDSVDVSSTGCL